MRLPFPLNLYAGGAAVALVVSLVTVPLWRAWARRVGLVDDPGHRKIHSTPVPLAGGWAVLVSIASTLALGGIAVKAGLLSMAGGSAQQMFEYGITRRAAQVAVILLGGFGMAMLGAMDDKYELRPAWKFGGQVLIAAAVACAGIRITLFVPSIVFSFVVTMLWILTITNAVNFLDNMNGLCGGLGVIGAFACGWSAAVQGQYLVASLAFVAVGALLGFLPYNYPKASLFLGDAGSHLVGYLLAVLAVLPHFYSKSRPSVWAVLSPLVILAVPLFDISWVVLHRLRIGQPIYVGDTNHISHRLVRHGFSKTTAVALIWLIAAACAAIALLVLDR